MKSVRQHITLSGAINSNHSVPLCCGWHWFLCFYHYEFIMNLTVWSLIVNLLVRAWYKYHLTLGSSVRASSGNCQRILQCLESFHHVFCMGW